MKSILIILGLFLFGIANGQLRYAPNHIERELSLGQMYLEYCYSDSSVVGYEYVLQESENMTISERVYTKTNHPEFSWNNHLMSDGYLKEPLDYIRKIEIKEPTRKPTFEGYIEWLSQIIPQMH